MHISYLTDLKNTYDADNNVPVTAYNSCVSTEKLFNKNFQGIKKAGDIRHTSEA